MVNFDCARSCPRFGESTCRFLPALKDIGPTEVCSSTVKVKVEFKDAGALEAAVKAIGGTYLGQGAYSLPMSRHEGLGFKLPGLHYPFIAQTNGECAYDNDYGANALDKLKAEYAFALAEQGALAQGWLTERQNGVLLIHHPSGGTLSFNGVSGDATGFLGNGCHEAFEQLGIPMGDVQNKAEAGQALGVIQQGM